MVLRRCQSPLNHGFWGMSNIRGKGFTHTHIYIYLYYIRIYIYMYIYTHSSHIWLVSEPFIQHHFWFHKNSPVPFLHGSGRGRWQHRLLQWWRHLLRRLQLFGILHGWSRALRRAFGGKIHGKPRGLGGKPMEHPGGTGNLMEKIGKSLRKSS